ncbi:hypothetical protein [Streptomyces sp. 135]|uniref:tetratricopeptide repeat protein n=1 Tax=Streptomyces sp. 135 TaxID=2838850 RepID=UPI001CC019A1|nr:hypothetical protein [Streptomyces sp. 135]
MGRVRLAAGDFDEAVAEFERARRLRPTAAGPLHWLGCAAAHRGDLAAARSHLTAALACAVPHRRSLVQRAYVHARAGDQEAALGDLRAASRIARWTTRPAGSSRRCRAARARGGAAAAQGRGHGADGRLP